VQSTVRCEKCRCPILRPSAFELTPPHSYPEIHLCWDCGIEIYDRLRRRLPLGEALPASSIRASSPHPRPE
jgi:hypothetical protein